MNKVLRYILIVIGLIIIACGGFVYAITRPALAGTDTIYLKIEKGMGANEIADKLYEKGLIRDPKAFVIWSKISNLDSKLEAGEYLIRTDMSMFEVASSLNGMVRYYLTVLRFQKDIRFVRLPLSWRSMARTEMSSSDWRRTMSRTII